MEIRLIKENEKGKVYQADNFKIFYRNKDSISGDNSENVKESIYLLSGSAEVTLKDKSWIVESPTRLEFPEKTYHKIKALTDITFILFEDKSEKTLLVDGMGCLYDEDFKVNERLLDILNSFKLPKILVVNGFKEKGSQALNGNDFKAFSLEEEGIKKDNPEYWKRLFDKFNLKPSEVIYIEHNNENVEFAKSLGVNSIYYRSDLEEIREFVIKELKKN